MDSENFNKIYQQLKDAINGKLTTQRLIILLPKLILLVQQVAVINKLTDPEKKIAVVDILTKVIKDSEDTLTQDEKDSLNSFIELSLPHIYDGIVIAYNSEAFFQLEEKVKTCCVAHKK